MKQYFRPLSYLTLICSLIATTPIYADATTDTSLDQQKADCAKSTSSTWDAQKNRCVQTQQASDTRKAADACNDMTDVTQREACHKALAEKVTGLSSNPNSLYSGNTTGSMVMNTAYAVVSLINMTGSKRKNSSCTSKTILGVTAAAGMASDFYLKYQASKKIKSLTDKYKLDVSSNASDSQIKALQYLKEEQQTVSDIAGLEKKRNMLLMMGYGAAGVMAAWEMTPWGKNPGCETGLKSDAAGSTSTPDAPSSTPAGTEPETILKPGATDLSIPNTQT